MVEEKVSEEKKVGGKTVKEIKPASETLKPTKIAVVRCDIVSEACPGVGCFKAFNERESHFENYDENAQMIAFFTCGGCSGRRVYRLLKALKKHEPDVVHLSSCMLMEGFYPKCPNLDTIRKTIRNEGIEIVEGTHH
ncbi:MAG: CGGC domain-containing protein [Methanosarcinaceae archaeon]